MKKTELEKKGLVYINDLLTDMGELMGYDNFQEIYNLKINFVDFYSLMHSIPRPWKMEILQQKNKIIGQVTQTCLEEILNMKKVCKETYWKIMDTIKPKRNLRKLWTAKVFFILLTWIYELVNLNIQVNNWNIRVSNLNVQVTNLKIPVT